MGKATIVKYVKEAFDADDIEKVWLYLGNKFHFNIPAWKEEFNRSLDITVRHKSIQDQFMEFGKKRIEPVLNDVLFSHYNPTWIILLSDILKDKIDVLRSRDKKFENRF